MEGRKMKKVIGLFLVFILLAGCAYHKIDKEYIKEHAQLGLSKEEIKTIFGDPVLAGIEENVEMWIYEETEKGFDYERSFQIVNHQAIRDGNMKWKLYVYFMENNVFAYNYFYLGENGEVWNLSIYPNAIHDNQVSFTQR